VSACTLADRINQHHAAAVKHAESAIEHARAAGELLLEAKNRCKHGEWLNWLAENVDVSQKTAWQYMRIAERWDEIRANHTRGYNLTVRKALKLARYGYSRKPYQNDGGERRA
jgi:hypothetical protein